MTSQTHSRSSERGSRLSGGLGAGDIIFMVVAAAAPLAVVGGVLPVGALTGNGAGMPSAFLVDGIILMFFAVGLATMSSHVSKPGAFFTYVAYGLGRPAGVAAAWLALLTYAASLVAVFAFLGLSVGNWIDQHLHVSLPWWLWTLGLVALVGVFGYRRVGISAKVLGILLVVEVGVVLVLGLVILFKGGADGITTRSFHPSAFTSGSPALALMWGMAGYAGFESTAIYRDEARDPQRTVPRATYGALVLIALFYTFASWALVQAWGAGFLTAVTNSTSNFVVTTADRYLGSAGSEIVSVLLLTSFFACVLSFHNVIARYLHAIANAGLLPTRLRQVHPQHRSPHIASAILSTLIFGLISLLALLHMDPYLQVYTWLGGIGTVAIVVLMGVTSLAVIVYLNRHGIPVGPWKSWIAPGLALVGLGYVTVLLFQNFPMLVGDVDPSSHPRFGSLTWSIYALMAAFPVFGLLQAMWLRRARPAAYEGVIGNLSQEP